MNTDIKQAMHVEAGKSFGTAEANENERRWDDDKIERKIRTRPTITTKAGWA